MGSLLVRICRSEVITMQLRRRHLGLPDRATTAHKGAVYAISTDTLPPNSGGSREEVTLRNADGFLMRGGPSAKKLPLFVTCNSRTSLAVRLSPCSGNRRGEFKNYDPCSLVPQLNLLSWFNPPMQGSANHTRSRPTLLAGRGRGKSFCRPVAPVSPRAAGENERSEL
jgi:hypothetical protein